MAPRRGGTRCATRSRSHSRDEPLIARLNFHLATPGALTASRGTMRGIQSFALLTVCMVLAACGSSDDAPPPTQCQRADRMGTYIVHFDERSGGTCGPIADSLVRISADDSDFVAGCARDAADTWSNGDCKLERSFSCPVESVGPGYTASFVATTSVTADGGSRLIGIETTNVYDSSGRIVCGSTYDLTYTRQ
jgi:hypothetical protein